MDNATKYLAQNLKFLRKQRGLQQVEMQSVLGFVRNTWSNWENGVSEPKLDDLIKIAHFFDTDLNSLVLVDLEGKGNLNENEEDGQKGNLISNPIGNLKDGKKGSSADFVQLAKQRELTSSELTQLVIEMRHDMAVLLNRSGLQGYCNAD